MKTLKSQIVVVLVSLVAGGVVGFLLHPTPQVSDEPVVSEKPLASPARSDAAAALRIAELRTQVQNLKNQLAESRKSEERAVSNALAQAKASRFDRPPSGRERLEELKKRDPARFAQITNRFARMHQERKQRQEARASFLSSVNTSSMRAADRETHDAYQELLARREELAEQMHQDDLSDESRRALMKEMREVDHQMRELGASERKVLLNEVAQAIGMQGDAAAELVETVGEIFDATESAGGPPGPPPGMMPPH